MNGPFSVQYDFDIVTSQVSSLVFGSSSRRPISLNQLEWISNSEKLEMERVEGISYTKSTGYFVI